MSPAPLATPLTALLGIKHPVMLAGMDSVAGPELAAAVSNAGGFGTMGGVRYTPDMLREMVADVKKLLKPGVPFGVDLLLPQVGGSARKTNVDYTKGNLNELLDIIIDGGAKLFVSAVGIPPRWAVDKLHKAGVLYMNVVGHPKHVVKACEAGADLICAQGGEAGGHTGDIPTSVLAPACADICKRYKSPLTGKSVVLVVGGGVNDGRSLAAALMYGASGVWVGTRFIPAKESKYPQSAKQEIIDAGFDSWVRTTIWTGRPLRALKTPYNADWVDNRQDEIKELTSRGVVPMEHELEKLDKEGKLTDEIMDQSACRPLGIVAGAVNKMGQPAGEIVEEIVNGAVQAMRGGSSLITGSGSKL